MFVNIDHGQYVQKCAYEGFVRFLILYTYYYNNIVNIFLNIMSR